MSLFQKIKQMFVKEEGKKVDIKKDSFLGAFFPKKGLEDRSYKDEKGLVSKFKGTYFDACVKDVEKTVKEIYDVEFDFKKTQGNEGIDYVFSHSDVNVKYSIKGTDSWESANDGYVWSNDVRAFLTVEDPSLTTEKLNKILTKMFEHHLIDYNNKSNLKFGVFYESSDKKFINGLALLKTVNVKPTEAMEFVSVMIYGAYKYKKFTDEELNELFGNK